MALENLNSMDAIFGMTQTGGKPKSRRTVKKTKTVGKSKNKRGGADGDMNCACVCKKDNDKSVSRSESGVNRLPIEAPGGPLDGGMSKMQYKAYLAKMDVKRLYKMAKNKGIKITKKKDGKTSYIKKDTVIQKLCDAMHGKKK